ncbi:amino acid adenylation domain-containing protein [Nocardiopsis sp. NPDC049922]|uniref:amino acid adenylation domain-containing protein n=1 Tax=Nocardiopsis sp. NPDC049922 TaxID=3155157 RepID=UPI0033D3C114
MLSAPDTGGVPDHAVTCRRVMHWAERHPDRPCVIEGGDSATFAHLLEEVNRNRRVLARRGVGPGDLVAIARRRRVDAIAGMLAAWSTGAAYLQLSLTLPAARVDQLLDLARPAAVLSDPPRSGEPPQLRVRDTPARRLAPSAAYVMFTSGSTGRPKGVVLGHDGLAALVRWHGSTTALAPGECASQVADLAFDASVWEIWGALAHGACLAVPSLDELLQPAELQGFLLRHRVRAAFVPTGLVPGLLDLEWPRKVPLRVLFTGGDRLTGWPTERHPFRLVNAYGPTECTVVSTCLALEPRDGEAEPPPIGRPLPHVRTRIARADGTAARPGERGELWLSGPALALGYLDDPPDGGPFVTEHGADRAEEAATDGTRRWYRTGDLVVEDADGLLHYLSRVDDQLQIQGRRTEPAEIVRSVLTLPEAGEAVVFTRETPSGDRRLAVAVTPATVSPAELQRHLCRRLPTYMIPSDIYPLDALPLTANGKFDLAALRRRADRPRENP